MKIRMIETGGWANIPSGCTIDTAILPDAVAEALVHALKESHLFVPHLAPRDARDARMISIEVVCGDTACQTSFSEAATPEAAVPILEILRPLCRPIPATRQG